MKFFTREVYEYVKPDSEFPLDMAQNEWLPVYLAYHDHRCEIEDRLPKSVSKLMASSMHLANTEIVVAQGDTLKLELNTERCSFVEKGLVRLTFHDAYATTGIDAIEGAQWLFMEIDLHPVARFEVRVLTADGEFSIIANAMDLELIHGPKTAHRLACRVRDSRFFAQDLAKTASFYRCLGLTVTASTAYPGSQMIAGMPTIVSPLSEISSVPSTRLRFWTNSLELLEKTVMASGGRIVDRSASGPVVLVEDPMGRYLEFCQE